MSSRNDRAKKRAARPEDFMDDEDLAELRESVVVNGIGDVRDGHDATSNYGTLSH